MLRWDCDYYSDGYYIRGAQGLSDYLAHLQEFIGAEPDDGEMLRAFKQASDVVNSGEAKYFLEHNYILFIKYAECALETAKYLYAVSSNPDIYAEVSEILKEILRMADYACELPERDREVLLVASNDWTDGPKNRLGDIAIDAVLTAVDLYAHRDVSSLSITEIRYWLGIAEQQAGRWSLKDRNEEILLASMDFMTILEKRVLVSKKEAKNLVEIQFALSESVGSKISSSNPARAYYLQSAYEDTETAARRILDAIDKKLNNDKVELYSLALEKNHAFNKILRLWVFCEGKEDRINNVCNSAIKNRLLEIEALYLAALNDTPTAEDGIKLYKKEFLQQFNEIEEKLLFFSDIVETDREKAAKKSKAICDYAVSKKESILGENIPAKEETDPEI